MTEETNTRQLARQVVDDFTYELHHTVTDPVIDFTRVPSKEIVKLIDHIELVIQQAMGVKTEPKTAPAPQPRWKELP